MLTTLFLTGYLEGTMASVDANGVGDVDSNIKAFGRAGGTLEGTAAIPTAVPTRLINMPASITSVGDVSASMKARGRLSVIVSIGANPSATDIAEAVWGGVNLEGTLKGKDLMRLLSSVAAGKTTIAANVATFRDVNDTKDRVVATMTGSERTTVVKDST